MTDAASVQAMDRSQLVAAWKKQFASAPGVYVSVKLMRSMLTYEVQANAHGGGTKQIERALRQRARQLVGSHNPRSGRPPAKSERPASVPALRPGVQLMREWNGRTYRVEVLDDGFQMDGKIYRSLTAMAKRITGAHWSGPRFFGLATR